MRRICQISALALGAALLGTASARAAEDVRPYQQRGAGAMGAAESKRAEEPAWTVELAPFTKLSQQSGLLARVTGNQMVPMLLVTGAQGYFTKKYGNFRVADPFRFSAWRGKDGKGGEVTLDYPSTDYVAKMVLNHPGAEKVGTDTVHLKEEGLYAVFSDDKATPRCVYALTAARARAALDVTVKPCPPDALLRLTWRGGTVDVKADEKGFFTETNRAEGGAALPKNVPILSAFLAGAGSENGVKRVDFATLKQTLFNLAKHVMGGGAGGK